MEEITFYEEWLSLDKNEFRILAMLADRGEYIGNLSDICRYFSLTPQTRNRNELRTSIENLVTKGFISCAIRGRTYHLKAIPKAKEIKVSKSWVRSLALHEKFSEDVAWEQVLKVYLWIVINKEPVVTNEMIAKALNISVSTIGLAKNVLQHEYEAIIRRKVSEKIGEDTFRTIGQELEAGVILKDI